MAARRLDFRDVSGRRPELNPDFMGEFPNNSAPWLRIDRRFCERGRDLLRFTAPGRDGADYRPAIALSVLICLLGIGLAGNRKLEPEPTNWTPVVSRLIQDHHDPAQVEALFLRPEVRFDPGPARSKLGGRFQAKFKARRIREIQTALNRLGFSAGEADGLIGPRTRRAMEAFQRAHRLRIDYRPTVLLLKRLQAAESGQPLPAALEAGPRFNTALLHPQRLAEGRSFLARHAQMLEGVERQYGLPPELATAILSVETRNGAYLGHRSSFVTLASLALCRDFEVVKPLFVEESLNRERLRWLRRHSVEIADWAYRELKALLEYARSNQADPVEMVGSIHGAIGICQFMPSNIKHYGVDGDGNGVIDLFNVKDALFSMANYLRQHGWRQRLSRRRQSRVIYRYNHSWTYVNTVLELAERLGGDGSSS